LATILNNSMEPTEEKVKKTLDALFKSVKTIEDLNNLKFTVAKKLEIKHSK